MHMSGIGIGEIGYGQWPGAGSVHGGCNPRKFSEKIALHTQRQAEDTAAFREVMMDITSIRVQAERVRGGSLPNVNQISRCSTETQFPCNSDPSNLTQHLLEADEGYRDIQPSHLAKSQRRHVSPLHSNRNWSSCSATEKSQMVPLPLTALNRTNSDSALHTSVRNTLLDGRLKSAQIRNPHTRHSGTYAHPVPLIEENIQEETTSPKLKKISSLTSSGCETPVFHNFPLPDQQVTSLLVPLAFSSSGSLPDLSSLHLPSPLPVVQDSEPQSATASQSGTDHLNYTSTNPKIMADFNLPSLSSSLQASLSNPLLQSSLSSPNIQSSLSSHSLPSSLSSTSLHLSLSNSSLQSSPSNHSLQSSLSSSSLSNQSIQSSASCCSYSSGIGGSHSCSSSSLSGSPRVTGHAHATPSRKRAQLSPLIVPSIGESRWQHPKQFSPTVSPTLSSITQGALLNPNKVLKETKPPAYPCSQLLKTAPQMSHQPVWQYFHPEAQHQSIPEMEQWSNERQPQQSQHQQTHSQTQQHHIHKQSRQLQNHSQSQTKYQQQLQHFAQQHSLQQHALQQPITQQQHHQPYTQANRQFQHHQLYEDQYQRPDQWQLPCQQGPYQGQQHQHHHQPPPLPTLSQEKSWNRMTGPPGFPNTQMKCPHRHRMQTQEQAKPQCKVTFSETQGERSRISDSGEREITASSKNKGFELNKESYVGLLLTPSQAKALSQQLVGLQKETLGGSRVSDLNIQASESKIILPQHNQSYNAGETENIFNINLSEQSSWLDQDMLGLPDSVLEFDLETFGLDSEGLPSLEDLGYSQ
ncbi:CREB-regulated transcription coactivator 2-like isoform X2 [Myxocyprinus asiaticus]|uniref:CREB-regulated transcription coactivator 2-like isoform X2 n=1 Tax=Myxocyprinus asiaticus TaxID=70543 RepID=UPI002222DDBA|nr:CREB-regulated transcription coactivator 2-like isoform X2 [Myxocyprinus asiaticus]